jgi:hypothetical protein
MILSLRGYYLLCSCIIEKFGETRNDKIPVQVAAIQATFKTKICFKYETSVSNYA